VLFRHLLLKGFDPGFLELENRSAFLAHQVVVVRLEVAFVPLVPVPEIKFLRVVKPCQKFHCAVDRCETDGTVLLPDGMGEFLDSYMRSRSEEDLDYLCPASASLPAGGNNFLVDPLEEGFQEGESRSKVNLNIIIMIGGPVRLVKEILRLSACLSIKKAARKGPLFPGFPWFVLFYEDSFVFFPFFAGFPFSPSVLSFFSRADEDFFSAVFFATRAGFAALVVLAAGFSFAFTAFFFFPFFVFAVFSSGGRYSRIAISAPSPTRYPVRTIRV